MCNAGSLKSSASRPKPGMLAVQPQPDGVNDSIVTFKISPGCAPSMNTGPVTGLILPKSIRPTSIAVQPVVSCPPDASATSNSSDSPGAIRVTAAKLLSQP